MYKKRIIIISLLIIYSIFSACDDGPLNFKIVSPKINANITSMFTLELDGNSSSPITSVELKAGVKVIKLPVGVDLKNPSKKWDIPIEEFEDGNITLSVTVKNAKNEIKTQSVNVLIQKPDPDAISVQITNPTEGTTITNNFILKTRVSSRLPVLSYWVRHKNINKWQLLAANDKNEWQLNINDFAEGEQSLLFTASNTKKTAKTSEVKITIQKPLPVAQTIKIKILSPKDNEEIKDKLSLKLEIESQLPIQGLWIKHKATGDNWSQLELNEKKIWDISVNKFAEGKQILFISAYNGKEYGYAKTEITIMRKIPLDKGPGFGNCYEPHGNFGNSGQETQKFNKPYYIQISNDRRLFVTDSRRNTVLVFDHEGKFLFSFGRKGTGAGEFDNPVGICIYKNEKIFVSDYFNRRVGIFSISGDFIKFFHGKSLSEDERFKLTGGVAVNDNGEVFVVDFDASIVYKFDTNGNFVTNFGKKGRGHGELDNPTGITISLDGFLYITDKKNDRVVVFDTEGGFSFNFGSSGSGPGELSQPMGIAVDKFNHIYVSDTRNNRILKFDYKGKFICEVAKNLVNPIGIAIDNQTGIVYVVDRDASLVKMFKPCTIRQ